MDKVAVSRAVARLLADGRLLREVHDGDRRRSVLRLSPDGEAIYAQVAPLALAFERQLLDGMDGEERALLFRLLDRLDELELRAEAGAKSETAA
jgi:DNA-binding MarR family transcriptional regulator